MKKFKKELEELKKQCQQATHKYDQEKTRTTELEEEVKTFKEKLNEIRFLFT